MQKNTQEKRKLYVYIFFMCAIDKYMCELYAYKEQQPKGRTMRINLNEYTALILMDFAERYLVSFDYSF